MLLQSLCQLGRNDFKGIVDLVKNEAIVWHDDTQGATFDVVAIPEMLDEVKEYRSILIEAVADYDENLLEKFMEDENSITEEEINKALRAAVMDMAIIPMIAGSSLKNKGVQFMLDAVCKYLPSQWIKIVLKEFILMMPIY
jgi:elongation factor G